MEALAECLLTCPGPTNQQKPHAHPQASTMKAHLIVAGGYDERLLECVQYYQELERRVRALELETHVTLVKSPSDQEKVLLLALSHAIVYTPEREHFGIVPLEAMAMSKPVIACCSGGPLETVEAGVSGLLCDSDERSFADAMMRLYGDRLASERMGEAGLRRVQLLFSYHTFRNRLNGVRFSGTALTTKLS